MRVFYEILVLEPCRLFLKAEKRAVDDACYRALSAILTVGRILLFGAQRCSNDWVYG